MAIFVTTIYLAKDDFNNFKDKTWQRQLLAGKFTLIAGNKAKFVQSLRLSQQEWMHPLTNIY